MATIKFSNNNDKEDKLRNIYEAIKELKAEYADVLDEFEDGGASDRVIDALAESLDALTDSAEMLSEVISEL